MEQQQPEQGQRLDIDKAATAVRRGDYVVLVDSEHRRYTVEFSLLRDLAIRHCGMMPAPAMPPRPNKAQVKAEAAEREAQQR